MAKSSTKLSAKSAPNSPGGGKSTAQLVRAANAWRDNYNPLRNLVIARVVWMMEAAERGDYAELELTVRKIEKRYPVLKGLKTRRLAALEELDWEVKLKNPLPQGVTEEMAKAQQAHLTSRYNLLENLTEVFGQLALAEFRGFSILQKHRFTDGENDGAVQEIHWLPQYTFSRDGQFGDWYYNKNSAFGIGIGSCASSLGEINRIGSADLPREDFVIREVEDPLYEIALIAFVNWAMARKDHAAFVEIFGLPNAVVIMPPNIPLGQEEAYRGSAEKVSDGVSGALPPGSDIKFPTSGFRNNGPFKEFCDAQDSDVVMAGTGGRLAMLTAEKGGLGDGPSKQHSDAFEQIARADARKINQALQCDFDKQELNEAFPGQPHCAYFELFADDGENIKDFCANVLSLSQAAKNVDTDFISEKTGYEFGDDQATPGGNPVNPTDPANPTKKPFVRNREGQTQPGATKLAAAVATDLRPFMEAFSKRVENILGITDPALRKQKLEAAFAELAPLQKDITADPTAANALAQITAPALKAGLEGNKP